MSVPALRQPASSSSYVDMLVDHSEGGTFTALETIREAGNDAHADQTAATQADAAPAPSNQHRATGREVAFRVSTPERIRRKSELLYGEIHTMMERHDARTGREREVQRRASRNSRVAITDEEGAGRRGDGAARSPGTSHNAPLPDLHQMFEESRRAHLTEAQQQRTYFPSSSKPTAYSSKDPGTFSYRFQSSGPSITEK